MPLDRTYANEIVDMLQTLGHVTGRAMFGGFGIWEKGAMFAAIDSDSVLYFKTNTESEADYRAAGAVQFAPKMPGRGPHPMPYWSVPAEVLDDQETLETWALRSIRIAHASKQAHRPSKRTTTEPQAQTPAKPRPATLPPKKKASSASTEAKPTTTTKRPRSATNPTNATSPAPKPKNEKARKTSPPRQANTPPESARQKDTTRAAQVRPTENENSHAKAQSRSSSSARPNAKKEPTTTGKAEKRAPEKRSASRRVGQTTITPTPADKR